MVEALHKADHVSAVACCFSASMDNKGEITFVFRMSMHKTNINGQRFYELIPVVTKAAWENLLGVLWCKGIEVKTLDSLNNKQMLLIAEGGKVTSVV